MPPYTLPDLRGAAKPSDRDAGAMDAAPRARSSTCSATPSTGRSPGQPEHLAFTVLEENPRAMDGAATLRRISDCQPPGAAIAPVRADALPAEHAGPRAGVPVHQQSAGLAHRPVAARRNPASGRRSSSSRAATASPRSTTGSSRRTTRTRSATARWRCSTPRAAGSRRPTRGARSRHGRGAPAGRWTTS